VTATETPARVDLLDPHLYAGDPTALYAWLRSNAPVYRDEVNGIWGVSRHRDVLAVEKETRRYSSAEGSRPLISMGESMINKDDPEHSAQRRLVAGRFTPRAVRHHEAHVRDVVTGLIDEVSASGRAEIVADLAAPLPAIIICELLGFDRSRWADCKRWSEVTMANAGYRPDDPAAPGGSMDSVMEFAAAVSELIKARRDEPRDDLVTAWTSAQLDGRPMPDGEIVHEALLLLDGGAETTRSVIGTTVLTLIRHPDQRQKLIDDPSIIGRTAVEEMIRWVTPILNMRRTATEDHELHGQTIRSGDQLLLLYGAANRDPEAFDDPDRFEVTRSHNHHVAFGFGTHFCLGANLARLEIRVMFEELLRRLPDVRLAPGVEPEVVPGYFARTLRKLPVEFTPAPAR
jgi:cytochrome P450 family 142 subfamily A polypeptide 1